MKEDKKREGLESCYVGEVMANGPLRLFGTDEQKAKYLPKPGNSEAFKLTELPSTPKPDESDKPDKPEK